MTPEQRAVRSRYYGRIDSGLWRLSPRALWKAIYEPETLTAREETLWLADRMKFGLDRNPERSV